MMRIVYGIYAWAVLIIVVLPVMAGLLLAPGLERRRRIARWGAASVFVLIGSRVSLLGDPAPLGHNPLVVANHASYLDGIILTAVLPPHYTFLIKHEMNTVPGAAFVLRRLGSEFVDRSDSARRHRSGRRLVSAAVRGEALAVFPEGTFDARPGLRPFRAGAFRAALRGRVPVLPVVIEGSRHKLPAGAWLPVPGPLRVRLCNVIAPESATSVAQLERLTRAAILAELGEPDLDAAGKAGPARSERA